MTYELFPGREYEIFNNGDDCLVIGEKGSFPAADVIRAHYLECGFHVELEDLVDVFERIDFCQTRPVWAQGWVMCRDLTAMAKDVTYIGGKSEVGEWFRAIGQCGLALTDGVPVFSKFYSCLAGPVKSRIADSMMYASGMTHLAKGMKYRGLEVTDAARLSFMNAFGIDADCQRAWEDSMRPIGDLTIIDKRDFFEGCLVDGICEQAYRWKDFWGSSQQWTEAAASERPSPAERA